MTVQYEYSDERWSTSLLMGDSIIIVIFIFHLIPSGQSLIPSLFPSFTQQQQHNTSYNMSIAEAEPAVRSSRTRVKSQRALESAYTDRLLRRAKVIPADPSSSSPTASGSRKNASEVAKKRKSQPAVKEVYCICKSDGQEGKPMIECGYCNDW
jgi:hypothetical protein